MRSAGRSRTRSPQACSGELQQHVRRHRAGRRPVRARTGSVCAEAWGADPGGARRVRAQDFTGWMGTGEGDGFAAARSTPSILHCPSNTTPFSIMREGVSRFPRTFAG